MQSHHCLPLARSETRAPMTSGVVRGGSVRSERLKASAEELSDLVLRGGSEALSKAMGMSLRTLRRHFERKGISLFAFRQARRASLAVNLLQRPEIRLRDLVTRLGFSNPASVARFVHSEFGMTPGELRRQLAPHDSILQS